MGLLDLVEQDDGVGTTAHTFRELSSLFIAHIAWRGTNEAADGKLLHILAHVDADEGIGRAEHIGRKFLRQEGLADACGTKEHEGSDGVVGVFEAHTVALDGTDKLRNGSLLGYDTLVQLGFHALQTDALFLSNTFHGDARHHGNNLGHTFLVNSDALFVAMLFGPLLRQGLKLLLQMFFLVAHLCSFLELLHLDSLVLLTGDFAQLAFHLFHLRRGGDLAQMGT